MVEAVFIHDVGPRDGLQNQSVILPPVERLRLISGLVAAGIPGVEIGSFVSPRAVPAMAGTAEVAAGLTLAEGYFSALVANLRGYELAKAAGVRALNLPVASTNTMNQKNIRMSTGEAMGTLSEIIAQGRADGIKTVPYIATAWECPFEGIVNNAVILDMASCLFVAGAETVVLADTIGAASPAGVKALMEKMVAEFGADNLACHFHDTRGFGVANAFVALESGIRNFDASIGGLGGCPFAPGATGNVATEDLAVLFEKLGVDTGIDLIRLLAASDLAAELTGNCVGGRSLQWLRSQCEKGEL